MHRIEKNATTRRAGAPHHPMLIIAACIARMRERQAKSKSPVAAVIPVASFSLMSG